MKQILFSSHEKNNFCYWVNEPATLIVYIFSSEIRSCFERVPSDWLITESILSGEFGSPSRKKNIFFLFSLFLRSMKNSEWNENYFELWSWGKPSQHFIKMNINIVEKSFWVMQSMTYLKSCVSAEQPVKRFWIIFQVNFWISTRIREENSKFHRKCDREDSFF